MNITVDSLIKQLQDKYRTQGISFDDSYTREVKKYYNWFLKTPKLAHWTTEYRKEVIISVISKVSEIAAGIARDRRENVIDASLFKEAWRVYARKYKFLPPWTDPDQIGGST